MHTKLLADDIVMFVGDCHESVATAFVHDRDVLLVDALADAEDARSLHRVLTGEMDKRVRMIVATHYMSDHMAGLHLFSEATVLAHAHHRQTYLSQQQRTSQDDADFVVPAMTFDGSMEIAWGRHRLRLMHNPGKTMDTINIDVPTADLVIAGDNIVGNIVYLSRAAPEMIDAAIERLQRLNRAHVVGGHMGCFPGSALANARHYLARLRQQVIAARRSDSMALIAGQIAAIRIEDCLAPGLVSSAFEREWHARNLDVIDTQSVFLLDARQAQGQPQWEHAA